MNWKDAVKDALRHYAQRHSTIQIDRSKFLEQELARVVQLTNSVGKTPHQTVSRVLQELRDEGHLFFSSAGKYVLNGASLDVLTEDAPEDVLENAAAHGGLLLRDVDVADAQAASRIRRGIRALRCATLANYGHTCALCDVRDESLLVTSHIARWADRPEARGLLSNTICFCRLHDALFEHGFFSLGDDLDVVLRPHIDSQSVILWLTTCTQPFRRPPIPPSKLYAREHRSRSGLN